MAFYSHHCRIQHSFPASGPCVNQGPQCFAMKHSTCITKNHPPFARCPEPCDLKCKIQYPESCPPKSPVPGEAKCAEGCDAACAEKSASPRMSPCTKPCHETCSTKDPLQHHAERCNLSGPFPSPFPGPFPMLVQSGMPKHPMSCGPKFGAQRGFPSSSRCFPPRNMYQYTASKTFKSCYAK